MATEIFSSVGRSAGGPVGEVLGSFAGRAIDGAISGTPGRAALSVQSAAYGEAIPRLYGTLRVSGGVLWSTGLKQEGAGLDKLSGGAGGQAYSTNIAIGISARPIQGVGRIWADGKLIRDVDGLMSVAGAIRIYPGSETQAPDPLIAAREGAGAPAYRGTAYVMFETLGLADFADRVPQFAFEVIADPAAIPLGAVAADMFAAAGAPPPDTAALTTSVQGYGIGGAADLGGALAHLALLQPLEAVDAGDRLRLRVPEAALRLDTVMDEDGAHVGGGNAPARAWQAASSRSTPARVEIAYFDPTRDYQPGLQIASAPGAVRAIERHDLPAVMSSAVARTLAERRSRELQTSFASRTLALPYRRLAIEVGDTLALGEDARTWRVRRRALNAMVVELEVEAVPGGTGASAVADAGRANANALARQGVTLLRALNLPAFSDAGGAAPRVWIAVAGDANWRAAQIVASTDGGASYAAIGVARTRAIIGSTAGVLPPGPCDRWDRRSAIEIVLADANDWLLSATGDAVLGGANLAVIGGELIQFRDADPIGPGRFRLSTLLRGRFGTEQFSGAHAVGEDFVLLDPARLFQVKPGVLPLGGRALIKAVGPLEAAGSVMSREIIVSGANLRPFAPAHLKAARGGDGSIDFRWTRRSRLGFDWLDGSDAPLGEESERYIVTITPNVGATRTYAVTTEQFRISRDQQIADTGGVIGAGWISVAQVSAAVGTGPASSARI